MQGEARDATAPPDPRGGTAPPGASGPSGSPAKSRRGYFLPGVIALATLLVIGAFLGAGDLAHPAVTTIDGPDIAQQIGEGIQATRASTSVPQVTCPAREPVRDGLQFRCSVAGPHGNAEAVYVTEIDSRGEIRWSLTPP